MRNLRYAAVEATAFPLRKLLLILLISMIFLESFTALQVGINLLIEKKEFEQTFKDVQVMHLSDTTFTLMKNEQKKVLDKFEELTNEDFLFYSSFSPQVTAVNNNDFYFKLNPSIDFSLEREETGSSPKVIEANLPFFNKFPVVLEEGRFFSEEDFQTDSKVIILGADYQSHYKLGDMINFGRADTDYLTNKKETLTSVNYVIIGFLKPQQLINLSNNENSFIHQSLNQQILLPSNHANDILPENDLYSYQLMISNVNLEEIGMTHLNQLVDELNDEFPSAHLVLNDSSQQIKAQLDWLNRQFFQLLIKLMIILIFCSVSFLISLKDMIKQRYQVFFVYLSIGSTKKDIILINYLMAWIMITTGFCLSLFIKNLFTNASIEMLDENLSIVTIVSSYILFSVWFSLLISPTLWRIRMINISMYLKEAFV